MVIESFSISWKSYSRISTGLSMTDFDTETGILLDLVKKRYGDRLTDEQMADVEKQLTRNLETAESLRSVELENGDEPYNVFKPYRRKE
jgi:hypothetical protein